MFRSLAVDALLRLRDGGDMLHVRDLNGWQLASL